MIVNTEGPIGAKIMFVGEAPGETEDVTGRPFMGPAGKTFNWMLGQANVNRHECLVTNVARQRPPGNKVTFYFEDKDCTIPKPIMREWIQLLRADIVLHKPNVIVALGNIALWALTGEKKISKFRGYIMPSTLVPGVKVIPTYHPQAVNYDWKLHFICILDYKKALRHSEFPQILPERRTLHNDAGKEQWIAYCQRLLLDDIVDITCDIETVQPGSHISVIGFSHSADYAMSIALLRGKAPIYSEEDETEIWYWTAQVIEQKPMIFHNAAYDVAVLMWRYGICCNTIKMCTLVAAHVCFPELPRDLGFLSGLLLDVPAWKHTARDNTTLYNAGDCANTMALADFFKKELTLSNNWDTFNFEMAELEPAIMMHLQGTLIDTDKQKELLTETSTVIEETKQALKKIIGREINYNSPKQLQQLLYLDLKLPVQYKRRKRATDPKQITASAEALKKLARLVPDNPIFNVILAHKKALKLRNSFLDIELGPGNRVYTSYNVTGKKIGDKDEDDEGRKSFGRWSSSESIVLPYGSGNLQNIPEKARKMYTVEEGYIIIQADYVQAEAVVVAYLSNDRRLIKVFQDSFGKSAKERKEHPEWDVHRLKASDLFNVKPEDVTEEQRSVGKTIRHARNYSAGPGVVASRLGCSMSQAKALLIQDDRANPLLKLWHESIRTQLLRERMLITPLGRKHRFLDRADDSLYRSAYSYIPQSTVGDLMNISLSKIYYTYPEDITLLLQLHDAVYVKCLENDVGRTIARLRQCMIHPLEIGFETMLIDVDFKIGRYWGDMDKIDWYDYCDEWGNERKIDSIKGMDT